MRFAFWRIVIGAIAAVVILIVAVMTITRDPEPDPVPVSKDCKPAKFRPAYLPWLGRGERVPVGDVMGSERDALLRWTDRFAGRPPAPAVTLSTEYESSTKGLETSGYDTLQVRGKKGYLFWVGDPGVGELALAWRETGAPCGSYALHLFDQRMSKRQAEAEIAKIAGNLE